MKYYMYSLIKYFTDANNVKKILYFALTHIPLIFENKMKYWSHFCFIADAFVSSQNGNLINGN